MQDVLRVIPDINLLVRALSSRGLPSRLLLHFQRGEIRFVVSADLLAELQRVLGYPRVLALGTGITPRAAFGLAVELLTLSEYHPFVERLEWPTLRDPKDWYLLDLLAATGADALLTLDKKLLEAGDALSLNVMTLEDFHSEGYLPPLEDPQLS